MKIAGAAKHSERGRLRAFHALAILTLLAPALGAPTPEVPSGLSAVEITRKEARWAGIGHADLLGNDVENLFVISGDVRNSGPRSIRYVKLAFELVDAAGVVVASEYGYNRRAEDLRAPDVTPQRRDALLIESVEPGGTDDFRMIFFRDEIPRFADWRVRILEAAEARER